jgi:chemotaxis protein CheD
MSLALSMQRRWNARWNRWVNVIHPGEVALAPPGELISTLLGSCVSVCLRDTGLGIGGMNHVMLPVAPPDGGVARGRLEASAYGAHAIELLVNALMSEGAVRSRFEAKLFGGGMMLRSATDIGAANVDFVRKYLAVDGIAVVSEDVGGTRPREIVFDPATGRVKCRRLPSPMETIAEREITQLERRKPKNTDVELFV